MTTNKTIKRVSKLVAGLAMSGWAIFAVGGSCQSDPAGVAGDVSALIGSVQDGGAGGLTDDTSDLKGLERDKWVLVSDRNAKTQFEGIDKRELLSKVESLAVSAWRYEWEPKEVRHIGPMAQDFKAAFGLGDSDRHIHVVDQGGVAIAAIQALQEEIRERDTRISGLESRLENLEKAVSAHSVR